MTVVKKCFIYALTVAVIINTFLVSNVFADDYAGFATLTEAVKSINIEFNDHYTSSDVRLMTDENKFADLDGNSAKTSIMKMYQAGIVNSANDNEFLPDEAISRAEFISIIAKAAKINRATYKNCYSDVSKNDLYSAFLQGAYNAGIIDGGTLSPNEPISIEDAKSIILKAYQYVTGSEMAAEDISGEKITRANAAVLAEKFQNKVDTYYRLIKSEIKIPSMLASTPIVKNGDAWKQAPCIFRLTEAVKPGYSVNLYGEGFYQDTKIAIYPVTGFNEKETPPADSTMLSPSYVDEENQFASFIFPKDAKPGAYYVWAENRYGWSEKRVLNGIKVQWISDDAIGNGQTTKVVGRNMQSSEFLADAETEIILTNGEKAYKSIIKTLTPFAADIMIPYDVPKGEYEIWATNDGIIWSSVEEGRKIEVKGELYDPISLNAGWVDEFKWNNMVNVKGEPYNANGDGVKNDALIIQQAIDDVKKQGGGIVYLPNGTYLLNNELYMPADVVLAGEDRNETVLYYSGIENIANKNLINMKDDGKTRGRVGFFGMTITGDINNDSQNNPAFYIWFGHDWDEAATNVDVATSQCFFIKDINFIQSFKKKTSRSDCVVAVNKKNFIAEGCNFMGLQSTITDTRNGEYGRIADNDFHVAAGVVSINGTHYVVKDNYKESLNREMVEKFLGNTASTGRGRHGFVIKAMTYCEGNTIKSEGYSGANDGEVILAEDYLSGIMMVGSVTVATGQTLTLSPYIKNNVIWGGRSGSTMEKWNASKRVCGDIEILIIKGTGLGQQRKVAAMDGGTQTCTVDRAWQIEPDSTSKFLVYVPAAKWNVNYKNYAENCDKGFWFYRGTYDSVSVENEGVDIEGMCVKCALTDYKNMESFDVGYFTRQDRNSLTGGGSKPSHGGNVSQAWSIGACYYSGKQPAKPPASFKGSNFRVQHDEKFAVGCLGRFAGYKRNVETWRGCIWY